MLEDKVREVIESGKNIPVVGLLSRAVGYVIDWRYFEKRMDEELRSIPSWVDSEVGVDIMRDVAQIRNKQNAYTALQCVKTIKHIVDYSHEQKISAVLHKMSTVSEKLTLNVAAVYRKYPQYHELISAEMLDSYFYDPCILLEEENYKKVKESENPVKTFKYFLKGRYNLLRNRINDGGMFSDDELEYILDTEDQVLAIHKEREVGDIGTIRRGFWDELNRALDQADGYKGKLRMMKQYCKEVSAKIKENAEELMYSV